MEVLGFFLVSCDRRALDAPPRRRASEMFFIKGLEQAFYAASTCVHRFRQIDWLLLFAVGAGLIASDNLSPLDGRYADLGVVLLIVIFLQILTVRWLENRVWRIAADLSKFKSYGGQKVSATPPSYSDLVPSSSNEIGREPPPSISEDMEGGITVVVGIRDRESARLRNLLRSIRAQTYSREKIRIHVVDYDSAPTFREQYRYLCEEFDAVLFTIGYRPLWSRSEALNIGIRHASTRFVMLTDADIIYAPNYIDNAIEALEEDERRIIHSTFYETGEEVIDEQTDVVSDFDRLRVVATPRVADDPKSTYLFGQSIICASTEGIHRIRGFDEFYCGWGSEDDDLMRRMESLGMYLYSIAGKTEYLHHSHPEKANLSDVEKAQIEINRQYRWRNKTILRNPLGWGGSLDASVDLISNNEIALQQRAKKISVVLPVYNQGAELRECLRGLTAQTLPSEQYEILVVDNGSTEPIEGIVREFPGCLYICEREVGSYAARNAGIARARGEIVAFIDADCFPEPDWLEKGHRYFFGPQDFAYVGGRVSMESRPGRQPNFVEQYDTLFSLNQERHMSINGYAVTANLFVRRDVLERAGRFNSDLKSGGDKLLGHRIKALRCNTCYAEEVVVRHPATSSVRVLVRRHVRYLGGDLDLAKLEGGAMRSIAGSLAATELLGVLKAASLVRQRVERGAGVSRFGVFVAIVLVRISRAVEAGRIALGGESRRT